MKKTIFAALLLLVCTTTWAQTFQGRIWYRKPGGATEPLPFAQVYYLEEKSLTDADENGRFSLKVSYPATLVATYIGYTRDTVVVTEGLGEADFYLSGENDLDEAVVTGRQSGLSKLKPIKTEVITAAGLCKMACCALAESFENSASVSVGYSDAVTGARQIKLLGLSGTYTQILDENRPVMRGLQAPFGMQYIPGQWLESIQIAKGPSSVINGVEAITGQIDMEHRKPTDETPLYLQFYGSTDEMFEGNIASAVQFNERWSVVNMAHAGGTASKMDHNGDGFRDEPEDLQMNFASRWLYYDPSGLQVRFGGSYVRDRRLGGQMDYTRGLYDEWTGTCSPDLPWGSEIKNDGIDGYVKVGIPFDEEQNSSLGLVADFSHYRTDSFFGTKDFYGKQNIWFFNAIYQNQLSDLHKLSAGLTFQYDDIAQKAFEEDFGRREGLCSAFGEYTLTSGDKFTFVGGLNLQYSTLHGWALVPRANIKYSLTEDLILRASGGRGLRTANIFTDNMGVFSTGRLFKFDSNLNYLEDAWTFGGNITYYLPFGVDSNPAYLSFDYFRSQFISQIVADQECLSNYVYFYNVDGKSYTNTYQVDFSVDPIERFNIVATFRYTDAKVTLEGRGLVERPMTSRFKGVLTMQYATAMNKWTFDFTAQVNGPMRLPSFAAKVWNRETSPVYPVLYAQITRKFRGIDVYLGGENLTNFRQKDAIIGAEHPWSTGFNASCVWGPLMGVKFYAGLRYTLWKL